MPPQTLLALLGLSPGVVTESLYEVLVAGHRPTKLVVLTTEDAVARMVERWRSLLRRVPADLEEAGVALFREFVDMMREDHPKLGLPEKLEIQLAIPLKGKGLLGDVRSAEDAALFQAETWNQVKGAKLRGERLLASLAGGRKTLSADLQQCMSLAGDADDLLFHVLVSDEHERPWFLYPGQVSVERRLTRGAEAALGLKAGDDVAGAKARITLYEVKFAPLRGLIGDLAEGASIQEVQEGARRRLRAMTTGPKITVRLDPPAVLIDGRELPLTKREAPGVAGFTALAIRAKTHGCQQQSRPSCQGCRDCFVEVEDLIEDWESVQQAGVPAGGLAALKLERVATRFLGDPPRASRIQLPLAAYAPAVRENSGLRARLPEFLAGTLRRRRANHRTALKGAAKAFCSKNDAWKGRAAELGELLDLGVGDEAIGFKAEKALVGLTDLVERAR